MLVGDLHPSAIYVSGALLGLVFGALSGKLADALPARYGIVHVATGARRARRNLALVALSAACAVGIAHLVGASSDRTVAHGALLLVTNALLVSSVLAAAAIDLEHMILPNELTLVPTLLCLVTSPLRAVGVGGAVAGAAVGLAASYLPFVLYKKLRGESGMGLGDAKLALMAGAWHGVEGALFVLFAGAVQSTLGAGIMHVLGLRYEVPESVRAEIEELRERARAGDEEAISELADDPMAGAERDGMLGMRLPLGPFLALACVEALFLRRWIASALGWLMQ